MLRLGCGKIESFAAQVERNWQEVARHAAPSRTFALGKAHLRDLVEASRERTAPTAPMRGAWAEAVAEVAELCARHSLPRSDSQKSREQVHAMWGRETTWEVVYLAVARCQMQRPLPEGPLTRSEMAIAECAFGIVARCRALLGSFSWRRSMDSVVGQLFHEMVVSGKVWVAGLLLLLRGAWTVFM